MMQDITIGQYYPASSVLHRMDPRVKIVGTMIYLVSVFLFGGWGFLLAAAVLTALVIVSKVPPRLMLRGLKPILIILVFTGILNIFLTPGEVLWRYQTLKITKEGLVIAGKTSMRLILLVIGASVMTLTTTPNKLTDALESLMRPLKALHVPVHEISMTMSIALRFIPIFTEETDRIKKAQMARGADFETGGLIRRVKAMVPLLVPPTVPLHVTSFVLSIVPPVRQALVVNCGLRQPFSWPASPAQWLQDGITSSFRARQGAIIGHNKGAASSRHSPL